MKARGIHLSADDLDEVAGELLMLSALLQRLEKLDADPLACSLSLGEFKEELRKLGLDTGQPKKLAWSIASPA